MLNKKAKTLKTKDGRRYIIQQEGKEKEWYIYCKLSAFDNNGREIGLLAFCVEGKQAILLNISVKDHTYLGQGVGYNLLNAFEQIAVAKGANSIEGLFSPHTWDGQYALDFYKRNGFSFVDKPYFAEPKIAKDLSNQKTETQEKRRRIISVILRHKAEAGIEQRGGMTFPK